MKFPGLSSLMPESAGPAPERHSAPRDTIGELVPEAYNRLSEVSEAQGLVNLHADRAAFDGIIAYNYDQAPPMTAPEAPVAAARMAVGAMNAAPQVSENPDDVLDPELAAKYHWDGDRAPIDDEPVASNPAYQSTDPQVAFFGGDMNMNVADVTQYQPAPAAADVPRVLMREEATMYDNDRAAVDHINYVQQMTANAHAAQDERDQMAGSR